MKPPIYNGLMKYISKQRIQFTYPGHKGKVRMRADTLCKFDTPILEDTDDISNPKGCIAESENIMADIYGSGRCMYLSGGVNAGIYALLAATCNAGDKVIVDPECGKAIINAITMLALIPVFILRSYNAKYDIRGGISTDELYSVTGDNSDAKAMIITSPTYYGVCTNIRKAAEITHDRGIMLFVDESQGAHFNFSDNLPESSIMCGADAVVQSCGETLGAFPGSGLLHLCSGALHPENVREQLNMIQSGSDSRSMLCALENAVFYAFDNSKKMNLILKELERGREIINSRSDILWFANEYNNGCNIDITDPTKIVLNFKRMSISAADAAKILINKYGIEPLSYDNSNIVFSVSLYNNPAEIRKLINSCISISKLVSSAPAAANEPNDIFENESAGEERITVNTLPYKAFYCSGEKISYEGASGRICRKCVYVNPQTVPVIVPGEKITAYHIDKISEIISCGGNIGGLDENGCVDVLTLSDSFYY